MPIFLSEWLRRAAKRQLTEIEFVRIKRPDPLEGKGAFQAKSLCQTCPMSDNMQYWRSLRPKLRCTLYIDIGIFIYK